MRETVLSSCEKKFVLQAIAEKHRLDGRKLDQCRKLKILFGEDYGCCMISMGDTRVLAQVSGHISQPKLARPNEGSLFINVELSQMAAVHFEPGRSTELTTELTRLMERTVRESRCIDMESLCIVVEEKAWSLRVDLTILNHAGNLADCCSVAVISALSHFRRPDVTVDGDELTIHSPYEREQIPVSVHHTPLCVTFGFFNEGSHVAIDPTDLEERIMEGKLVLGMNPYKEICALHLAGSMLISKEEVLRCTEVAAAKVLEVAKRIKEALQDDAEDRAAGRPVGFAAALKENKLETTRADDLRVQMDSVLQDAEKMVPAANGEPESTVRRNKDGVVQLVPPAQQATGEGGPVQWSSESSSESGSESGSESSDGSSDVEAVGVVRPEDKIQQVSLEDSEEEETETLQPHHLGIAESNSKKAKDTRQWYENKW